MLRRLATNRTLSESSSHGHSLFSGTNATLSIRPSAADNLTLYGHLNYQSTTQHSFANRLYDYPSASGTLPDFRRQYTDGTPNHNLSYKLSAKYQYFLTDQLFLTAIYEFEGNHRQRNSLLYRLDQLAGWGQDGGQSLGSLPSVTYDTAKLIVPVGAQTRYQAAEGWKEFKCLAENGVVPDTGGGTDFGNGGLDEDTPLDGNVVGNIYYSIADDAGLYSSAEGCLVLRKPVTDDEMADVEGKDLFGEALRDHYTDIIFMVQAGTGLVKVNTEAAGGMTLKVKIGSGKPVEMALSGRMEVSIPYDVTEPTFIYVYAGSGSAAVKVKGLSGSASEDDGRALKIYGIAREECDIMSIAPVYEGGEERGVFYNLQGQRVSRPVRGVYVHDGRKVLVR